MINIIIFFHIITIYKNRRLLKDSDGDLAKISIENKKQLDSGQQWRFLKNYARVFKNPIGYAIWRFRYAHNQNRAPSLWYMFVGACLFAIFFQMKNKSKSKI